MKRLCLFLGIILSIGLGSCATKSGPQVYHEVEHPSLVITSTDGRSGQIIVPAVLAKADGSRVLEEARLFNAHQTAVIILEGYSEPEPGPQFQARSFTWFMGLRSLGYQHIVFVQGRGVNNPDGLTIVAEYD